MSRVRMPGFRGYQNAGDFAWSGWRYRIPGGPEGGQYHGYIAPDSTQSWEGGQGGWPGGKSEITDGPQRRPSGHSLLPGQGTSAGPWAKEWGGTSFDAGEDHSDYVYRASPEMRPRPNASGGQNVIFGHEDRPTAGYAEAPGNYRGLGMMMAPLPGEVGVMPTFPIARGGPVPYIPPAPATAFRSPGYLMPLPVYTGPDMQRIPSYGSGATNVVAQPPAPTGPVPISLVPWTPVPISPSPSPTVAASPYDFLPSQGQVIDGLTPGTPSAPATTDAFSTWLQSQTIIPGVANQWLALAAVALFAFSGRGKK